MKKAILMIALFTVAFISPHTTYPQSQLAPDGTYVGGSPQLAPDGTYVGGSPHLAPDGTYTGGRSR